MYLDVQTFIDTYIVTARLMGWEVEKVNIAYAYSFYYVLTGENYDIDFRFYKNNNSLMFRQFSGGIVMEREYAFDISELNEKHERLMAWL
ncbi:hypothetical protein D3C81_1151130 [compost metagenome]